METSNPTNTTSFDSGDGEPVSHSLRFVRELFADPERTFSYIALRIFGWSPTDLIALCGDLTLKEAARLFEQELIRRGEPAALVGYWWQEFKKVLRGPPRRGSRLAGKHGPLNEHALRELFPFEPEKAIPHQARIAEGLIHAARDRAAAGDRKFAAFWDDNGEKLERALRSRVRRDCGEVSDIVNLTWLAAHVAHDTNRDWSFSALLTMARELHRRAVAYRRREAGLGDAANIVDADARETPADPMPDYVLQATFETVFDGALPPHETTAFRLKWLFGRKPREIAGAISTCDLYDLNSAIYARYHRRAPASIQPIVKRLFAEFDVTLDLTYKKTVRHKRRLRRHRRLHHEIVGWTRLEEYLPRRKADRARAVTEWLASVKEHLKVQQNTVGTPLYEAFRRWDAERNGDPDDPPEDGFNA